LSGNQRMIAGYGDFIPIDSQNNRVFLLP